MSATVYDIPEKFKKTLPNIFDDNDFEQYEKLEKEWIGRLSNYIRDNYGSGQYVGRTIRFPVADGEGIYMVMRTSPVQLIHLPLMDGYQSEFAHLMTAKEVKKRIDASDRMTAYLNSWKSQTVGDVNKVIEAHGIKSDEPREGYQLVEWLNVKYLLPTYESKHGYDHGIYKYLCNLKLRTV